MNDIRWYEQSSFGNGAQWYFHGEPCQIIALGVVNKKVKKFRIRDNRLEEHVVSSVNGEFPGVTYQSTE